MPVEIGPYTKIPNRLFGSGLAAKLGSSATIVYVALCDHANRDGKNTFKASDRAIAADTGISERTIVDARKALVEHGLIQCARENGQSYVYTLLAQKDLIWVPIKNRSRQKCKPRAIHAWRAVIHPTAKSPEAGVTPSGIGNGELPKSSVNLPGNALRKSRAPCF